jgi:hypothetical protein
MEPGTDYNLFAYVRFLCGYRVKGPIRELETQIGVDFSYQRTRFRMVMQFF